MTSHTMLVLTQCGARIAIKETKLAQDDLLSSSLLPSLYPSEVLLSASVSLDTAPCPEVLSTLLWRALGKKVELLGAKVWSPVVQGKRKKMTNYTVASIDKDGDHWDRAQGENRSG